MTTGLSYAGSVSGTTSYVDQIATMAVVDATDPAFLVILPQMITYAENRIYRDVDFLFTSTSSTAYSLTVGTRSINVPAGTFVVPEQINLITPVGVSNPDQGTRVPLLPTTKEFLDAVYGASALTGQPKYWVPFDDYTFLVGPYPDAAYTVEIVGTIRPQSLGNGTNNTVTSTFISLYLPDLFIMASMIYIAAYQRNFSSALGNDPQMPITYETQYQTLLKSAVSEENRKKFEASAWSSQSASTTATPTRG
jgi:hypothetical protein